MLTSSDLLPHTTVPIPPEVALPQVLAPPPGEVQPPVLDPILGSELNGKDEQARRPYIAKSFPTLPSRHTWKTTPVFPARETDPRKIRERATQEGVLAEQALRKLAAARKNHAPQKRGGYAAKKSDAEVQKKKVWEDALASMVKEDQVEQRRFEERQLAEEGGMEVMFERPPDRPVDTSEIDNGLLVNYDRKNWRKAPGSALHV